MSANFALVEPARSALRPLAEAHGILLERNLNAVWRNDGAFAAALGKARLRTLLRPLRCFVLWEHARMWSQGRKGTMEGRVPAEAQGTRSQGCSRALEEAG